MLDNRVKKMEEAGLGGLKPRDRVKMILEAGARGDRGSAEKLAETCPRFTYRTPAAEFLDGMDRARALANAGTGIYERARYALGVVKAFEETNLDPADSNPEIGIPITALLREQRRYILLDFRAAWAGYDTLCREACGVDGLKILGGIPLAGGRRLPDEYLANLGEMIGAEVEEDDREHLAKMTDYWAETLREAFPWPAAE